MSEKELSAYRRRLPPYAVVRARARVLDEAADGGSYALLHELLGPDRRDAALRAHAKKLQEPVTLDDPALGAFTFDRRMNWYTAKTMFDGRPVELHLEVPGEGPAGPEGALRTARALWPKQKAWAKRVVDFAAREMLDDYNETWREEGDPALSAEGFRKAVTLNTVTADGDGAVQFWFYDGDLFGGHDIVVRGTLTAGPTEADIAG